MLVFLLSKLSVRRICTLSKFQVYVKRRYRNSDLRKLQMLLNKRQMLLNVDEYTFKRPLPPVSRTYLTIHSLQDQIRIFLATSDSRARTNLTDCLQDFNFLMYFILPREILLVKKSYYQDSLDCIFRINSAIHHANHFLVSLILRLQDISKYSWSSCYQNGLFFTFWQHEFLER